MSEFYLKVAGVTFEGRQRVIAGLTVGQNLRFVPDPSNPYDSSAVKIVTEDGTQLGFIGRNHNSQIFDNLVNQRGEYQVSVSSITGGGFGTNYGCNIKVVYTEKPNKRTANARDFAIEDGCLIKYKGMGDDIEIPVGVTSIGKNAFQNCESLESVVIPDSVASIGESAFQGCTSLESIEIPDSVTSIGKSTFQDCETLERVVIPDSVTSIGESAFQDCTNLESVEIPDSVTSIGESAFSGCIFFLLSIQARGYFESESISREVEMETLQARKEELDREIAAIKGKNEQIRCAIQNVPAAQEYIKKEREYSCTGQDLNSLSILSFMRKKELKQKLEVLSQEKEQLRSEAAEQRKALLATIDESLLDKEKERSELEQSIEELKRQIELDSDSPSINHDAWHEKRIKVESTLNDRAVPMLTSKFYISSYACPLCGRPMYKTVFPVGGEYVIHVSNGKTAHMKRVFTCPECRYFVTAAIDKLSDGLVYAMQHNSQNEYIHTLYKMDFFGSTQGRRD